MEMHSLMVGIFDSACELSPMDEVTIKTPNPKCCLYWCLIEFIEILSVMMVFSTPLVYCCPYTFSLTSPLLKVNVQYIQRVAVAVEEWGVGGR